MAKAQPERTKYLVETSAGSIDQIVVDAPDPDEGVTVSVDGRDVVGITFRHDSVEIGYWPDGEEWVEIKQINLADLATEPHRRLHVVPQ